MFKYITSALLLMPTIALADSHENGDRSGFYARLGVGVTQPVGEDFNGTLTAPVGPGITIQGNAEAKYDRGGVGCVAGGYREIAGFPVMLEAEACYRKVTFDELQVRNFNIPTLGTPSVGGPVLDLRGDSDVVTGMGLLWVYLPTDSRFTPRIGGGVGVLRQNTDIDCLGAICPNVDDTVTGPAWQIGAGLDIDVSERFFVSLDYRHVAEIGARKYKFDGAAGAVPFSIRTKGDGFETDEFLISGGIRF